jgi:hypothetical protein
VLSKENKDISNPQPNVEQDAALPKARPLSHNWLPPTLLDVNTGTDSLGGSSQAGVRCRSREDDLLGPERSLDHLFAEKAAGFTLRCVAIHGCHVDAFQRRLDQPNQEKGHDEQRYHQRKNPG